MTIKGSTIIGHEVAKRALEVALVGCHKVLLIGPSRVGKTALAKAYPDVDVVSVMSCPCGNYQRLSAPCTCNARLLERWVRRINRVLVPDADIICEVCEVPYKYMVNHVSSYDDNHAAARVARALQMPRPPYTNEPPLNIVAERTLEMVVRRLGFQVGRVRQMISVSRSIAMLGGSTDIQAKHIAEACQYQYLPWLQAQ